MANSLRIITPADDLAVSLSEAKAFARIDADVDDALVLSRIRSAVRQCQHELGAGATLLETLFELTLDDFPAADGVIELPARPATALVSIKYDPADGGAELTMDAADYVFTASAAGSGERPLVATVQPAYDIEWPDAADGLGKVRIRFKAGWADASEVPDDLKTWIMVRVADFYGQRESYAAGLSAAPMPGRFADGLLDGWRLWGVG